MFSFRRLPLLLRLVSETHVVLYIRLGQCVAHRDIPSDALSLFIIIIIIIMLEVLMPCPVAWHSEGEVSYLVWWTLCKANVPSVKEPSGLVRDDGKRP